MRARTLLAAVSWLSVAVPGHAVAPHYEAVGITGNAYLLSELTIVEGDTLTFTNLDPGQPHDLVSPDFIGGNRRFRSDHVYFGGSAPVSGVERLTAGPAGTPGVYTFVCTLHFEMTGRITVLPAPAA